MRGIIFGTIAAIAIVAGCGQADDSQRADEDRPIVPHEDDDPNNVGDEVDRQDAASQDGGTANDDAANADLDPRARSVEFSETAPVRAHVPFDLVDDEGYTFDGSVAFGLGEPKIIIEHSPPGQSQLHARVVYWVSVNNTTEGREATFIPPDTVVYLTEEYAFPLFYEPPQNSTNQRYTLGVGQRALLDPVDEIAVIAEGDEDLIDSLARRIEDGEAHALYIRHPRGLYASALYDLSGQVLQGSGLDEQQTRETLSFGDLSELATPFVTALRYAAFARVYSCPGTEESVRLGEQRDEFPCPFVAR